MCGSIFFASTLLFQCCFCCLGLIHSSRFALMFRACCPRAFPAFSSSPTYCLPPCHHSLPCLCPLGHFLGMVCLWVSRSFFVSEAKPTGKNPHQKLLLHLWSLIFTCCCSLLSQLLPFSPHSVYVFFQK